MHKLSFNLHDQSKSDFQYKISQFPDGQQTIDITNYFIRNSIDTTIVHIYTSIKSFKDLELVICANQAIRNLGFNNVELHVFYFLGGRSDIKFNTGGVNYIKDVIAPIINLQKFNKVWVLDPHSNVIEATINNFEKIDNYQFIKFALTDIDNKNNARSNLALVSPDAGASKKVFDVAKHFKITDVIHAAKHRDILSGQILRTEVDMKPEHVGKNLVIIDDICDGGRTFIEIAKEIRRHEESQNVKSKLFLVVTHGIFSAGFSELSKWFEDIYTTDSYHINTIESANFVKTYKNKTL